MNSKKILLLSVISFCTANAQDDLKKNITRTVGGVASAAALVGVETMYIA